MSVAARLRKLTLNLDELRPLLADVVEAAEKHRFDNDNGRDMRKADARLYTVLVRLSEQLGGFGETGHSRPSVLPWGGSV